MKTDLLTLACAELDHQVLLSKLKTVFPPSMQLEFTIVTGVEIKRAIDVYYKGKTYKENAALALPKNFTILSRRVKSFE